MANHYDFILAGISGFILTGGTAAELFDISLTAGVAVGAVGASALIAYGLFVDPPRDPALGPHQ